jgi:hypothetical protein
MRAEQRQRVVLSGRRCLLQVQGGGPAGYRRAIARTDMNSVGVSTAPCGRRRWHVHREAFVLDTTHSYTTLFALSPLAFIWWRCEFYRWNWRNPVAPRIATRVKLRILFRIWARACCMAGIGKMVCPVGSVAGAAMSSNTGSCWLWLRPSRRIGNVRGRFGSPRGA